MPVYSLDGHAPELPPEGEYWIAPDAHVIGRVRLAPGASVWFGSVLRGDNEIIDVGPGTNIQEACILHTDIGFPMTLGAGCTVGHGAVLHGCTLGDNTLVGMRATVLNGATIAPDSLVGAGALVTEGRSFPERSLIVGAPARAIRTLDDEAVAKITRNAQHYLKNWKRFAARLVRIA